VRAALRNSSSRGAEMKNLLRWLLLLAIVIVPPLFIVLLFLSV
jgi:hypothetical protein